MSVRVEGAILHSKSRWTQHNRNRKIRIQSKRKGEVCLSEWKTEIDHGRHNHLRGEWLVETEKGLKTERRGWKNAWTGDEVN